MFGFGQRRRQLDEQQRNISELESQLNQTIERLNESFYGGYPSDFVDPRTPYHDDGEQWIAIGGRGPNGSDTDINGIFAWRDEEQLRQERIACRNLSILNEFAINGHENRISYIVGSGHTYTATSRPGEDNPELLKLVQEVLDEFLEYSEWHCRQQEIVRRFDRDGEVFLRFFVADNELQIRFVEPWQVSSGGQYSDTERFGIITEPKDAETVRSYRIDGQIVEAAEIQHRKANVDSNALRGNMLFRPVRKNLIRAEKLLRNMMRISEIQTAIAVIRRHPPGISGANVSSLLSGMEASGKAKTSTDASGRSKRVEKIGPATIVDVPSGITYEYPAGGIDLTKYLAAYQAELRAIASRLVMPEFMLTSDASNANYASTMVAEGPAVRMFERAQYSMIVADQKIMRKAIELAVERRSLPADTLKMVKITATPPNLAVRNRLEDAQVNQIESMAGVLSIKTWSAQSGYDYEQEQQNIAEQRERNQLDVQLPKLGSDEPEEDLPVEDAAVVPDETLDDQKEHLEHILLLEYSDDQPRDDDGKWSDGGGGSSSVSVHTSGQIKLKTPKSAAEASKALDAIGKIVDSAKSAHEKAQAAGKGAKPNSPEYNAKVQASLRYSHALSQQQRLIKMARKLK